MKETKGESPNNNNKLNKEKNSNNNNKSNSPNNNSKSNSPNNNSKSNKPNNQKNKNSKKEKIKQILLKEITKEEIVDFFKNNILNIYIIINIIYILIGSFLVKTYQIFFSEYATGYIYLFLLNIAAIIILLITKKYKYNITHIFTISIAVFAIISTIFAVNQHVAIYGFMDRWEGLFSILYYLTIMFLSSFVEEKHKKIIIYLILFGGAIQAIYGICQTYNIIPIPTSWHNTATGFTMNPNFFGTYMLLNICYALGLYIDENKKGKKIIFIILSILFIIGQLMCNTMSSIVGLAIVFAYILIYCIKNKQIRKLLVIIAIIVCTTIFVDKLGKTRILNDITKTTREAFEITHGNTDDSFGSGRMYIWKETLKIVPKYLIHGVGIDNFYFAFDGGALTSKNGKTSFDKVHNEYLQTLVTQGIFSLLSYLALYFIIVKRGIKESFTNKEVYLILPVLGYLVQAFFNISVIEVAPIFYIALGICINTFKNEK